MDVSNRRIVILGKTGIGKSSLANTIFGEQRFKIGHTVNSYTNKCQAETKSINGRNITLIDTPGFFDTDRSEKELKFEILRCIVELSPGPHAFLIVVKVDRYTEHEQAVITKIKQHFSEEVLKYATVVFTHGDQLEEEQTIEDFVRDNKLLRDLVEKCGGRCHVVDNKYWKNNQQDEYRTNQFQVEELLNTIDLMVEANEGRCYTNEMLQAVEERIIHEMQHIRQLHENMPEEEIRELARCRASERPWSRLAGIVTGVLEATHRLMVEKVNYYFSKNIDMSNRRIVILGNTGIGKSSLANTIFGEKLVQIGHKVNSDTKKCQAVTKPINGRNVTLIDTPGFFDTHRSEKDLKSAIVRCIIECAPGPHAFVILLKVERYTEQEQAVITKINQYFSKEVFQYATVLFTHGDQLEEEQTIEDFVRDNELLSDLIKKCGGRCHVIDNKYWKNNQQGEYRSNQFQVKELLKTIDKMVEANRGRCYTNEALQAVEERIKQEMQLIRQSHENMPEEEIREEARRTVSERPWLSLAGITTSVWEGALFGVERMVKVVVSVFNAGIGVAGSTITAGVGAVTGCRAAQGADTHLEAAETGRH